MIITTTKNYCVITQRMNNVRPGLVGSRRQQKKSDEAVEIRMIVPYELIQKKQVPIRHQERCTAGAEKSAKHDPGSTFVHGEFIVHSK